MGKVSKVAKILDKKNEDSTKVKKLVNKPGVSKASAKLNLKDARVPLMQILKNKSNAVENVNALIEDNHKPIKMKKNLTKPVKNIAKTKPDLKVERLPIMKTLKRRSSSENAVKPPRPKKKENPANTEIKKQTTKVLETISKIGKKKKVQKKEDTDVDEKIPTKNLKPEQKKTEGIKSVDKAQVLKGVSAVLKLAQIQAESKKNLFDGEHQPIFLQVTCIKIPKVPNRRLRIMLPHTLVTDTDDVVLFVADQKRGRKQDFELTINHYQDILRKHGCTQIKDVIPLTQVKTEYDQFELKRKLLSSYDYFLTDGKIAGHLCHILGKTFTNKRKLPTSIKMDTKNLKLAIDNALRKTSMQLHSYGNSNILQVAHTAMKKKEILSNVLSVCKTLATNYPGGWGNIRSLILKTATSLSVPIYLTLKSKNKIKVPIVAPTRPKAHRTVSGDLSTAPGNIRVIVKPDGEITVKDYTNKKNEAKLVKSEAKKSDLATDRSATKKSKGNRKKTEAKIGGIGESVGTTKNEKRSAVPLDLNAEDSKGNSKTEAKPARFQDSEDEIEEAEQAYLNQWQEESSTPTTEEKQPKKKSKIINKKSKIINKNSKIVKKKKTKA